MVIRSILHILWSGIVTGNELFPVGGLRFSAGPLLTCDSGVDRNWNPVMFCTSLVCYLTKFFTFVFSVNVFCQRNTTLSLPSKLDLQGSEDLKLYRRMDSI